MISCAVAVAAAPRAAGGGAAAVGAADAGGTNKFRSNGARVAESGKTRGVGHERNGVIKVGCVCRSRGFTRVADGVGILSVGLVVIHSSIVGNAVVGGVGRWLPQKGERVPAC